VGPDGSRPHEPMRFKRHHEPELPPALRALREQLLASAVFKARYSKQSDPVDPARSRSRDSVRRGDKRGP